MMDQEVPGQGHAERELVPVGRFISPQKTGQFQ
jgi:hypothetical protein